MLVLTRRNSQQIICRVTRDNIAKLARQSQELVLTLTVVRVGSDAVRLGFEAPSEMNIVREEISREEGK